MVHNASAAIRRRRTATEARAELLEAVAGYVEQHGVGDFSVRRCAEAIGTSHRMLLYHFGSKERLLSTVITEVRRRQMAEAVRSIRAREATPTSFGRAVWDSISSDVAALQRNLEVVGLGLLEPDRYGEITVASIQGYIAGIAAMLDARLPEATRSALATAITAAVGGLQIDLALTRDRERVDAAYAVLERIISEWSSGDRPED